MMENSSHTPQNATDTQALPKHFFKTPGISSDYAHAKNKIADRFKGDGIGISRSIRTDIVAAALRDAGVSNPVILPRSVTRR